ncbi:MAG: tRNA pseudouridine(55) synthase TruB [Christensenellales bacterium]|jgi:tRNA pseudouridine55 synthase
MNGVINVLKPPGMTSSNVVSALRRILNMKRVGHTGTLDPGAAGVLPVCVGKATRLFDYIVDKDKEYIAELCLGKTTDTLDSYGQKTGDYPVPFVDEQRFSQIAAKYLGEIVQTVPAYSAAKVEGRKLYQMARKGQSIDAPQKNVVIRDIQLLRKLDEQRFLFRVVCSKGTYVRTLCADIAQALGSGGYMAFLLRNRSGMFEIDSALTLEEIETLQGAGSLPVLPPDAVLGNFGRLDVLPCYKKMLANGNALQLDYAVGDWESGPLFRVYCEDVFYGIARQDHGRLAMKTLFI